MNRAVVVVLLGLMLAACTPHTESKPGDHLAADSNGSTVAAAPVSDGSDEIIATVGGQNITMKDMHDPLLGAIGLQVLMDVVQRDLAWQEAAKQGLTVTPDDVKNEIKTVINGIKKNSTETNGLGRPTTQSLEEEKMSPEDEQRLLDQVLAQQHVSRAEFQIIIETNAALRKIAAPKISAQITEEALHNQFNAMYGEKVRTRYIACSNMLEVAAVRRDLAEGKSFAEVARARSIDHMTAPNGGELAPFSRQDTGIPDEFKTIAFSLAKGQVSEPLEIGKYICLIQLIDRIPPKLVKFEDYHDSVRDQLYEMAVDKAIVDLRNQLGRMALASLRINNPILKAQWDERLQKSNGEIQDRSEIRKKLEEERERSQKEAATQPASPGTQESAPAATTAPSVQ